MKLYYETPGGGAKLYHGDSRRMPEIETDSIDMIATSPPYWGKRDYGEDVVAVWGCGKRPLHRLASLTEGQELTPKEPCEHIWGEQITQRQRGAAHGAGAQCGNTLAEVAPTIAKQGAYCSLCGAWRGQLGLEPTWQEYIFHLCECAEEWWRVLKPTGNLFVNMGDTFAGSHGQGNQARDKDSYLMPYPQRQAEVPKMKLGIPFRLRFALNDMGWVSRDDIIWYKGKEYPDGKITKVAMPESVKDRMSCSYEMLFHFVKEPKGYWFDLDAVRKPLAETSIGRAERYQEAMAKYGSPERPDSRHREGGVNESHAYAGMASGRSKDPYNPAGANPGDVWIIQPEPFKLEHYAVWPSELCERMIKVGCPKEVCPKCGKPRERIRQPSPEYAKHLGKDWADYEQDQAEGRGHFQSGAFKSASLPTKRNAPALTADYHTIGWSDCGCGEGFVPGVTLDPFFGGSGRIAERALYLGRNVIGVDMKKEYLEMAKKRLLQGVLL